MLWCKCVVRKNKKIKKKIKKNFCWSTTCWTESLLNKLNGVAFVSQQSQHLLLNAKPQIIGILQWLKSVIAGMYPNHEPKLNRSQKIIYLFCRLPENRGWSSMFFNDGLSHALVWMRSMKKTGAQLNARWRKVQGTKIVVIRISCFIVIERNGKMSLLLSKMMDLIQL